MNCFTVNEQIKEIFIFYREELKQYTQSLSISDEGKEFLIKKFIADEKKIIALEFKLKRTLIDKTRYHQYFKCGHEEGKSKKR